jgi:uncharacterized protein YtpQ (UPF0354 family)
MRRILGAFLLLGGLSTAGLSLASLSLAGLPVAILPLAGLSTVAHAQAPTPSAFTAQFARALQAELPTAKIRILGELRLEITRADGTSAMISLANNYRDYSSEPGWFAEVVKAYAAAMGKPSAAARGQPVDPARIVPVIKDRAWLAELAGLFKKQGRSDQPVYDDFNNELVVVYAEDTPKTTRYVGSSEKLGVDRSKLRELALENVVRLMPPVELRDGEGFIMMTSHADYGASLLLIDQIWSGQRFTQDDDIVIAVPSKDVILITGSRNRRGLKAMRTAASNLAKGSYGITDTLFVYRKGRFVKFGRN